MIDTHTHIYVDAFDEDRDDVIERALTNGVEIMMCPAIDSSTHQSLFDLCNKYPKNCLPMIGLHPTHVNDNPRWHEELDLVERYLQNPPVERFYAIGEIGIDLYWSKDWIEEQKQAFIRQIEISIEYNLPLVIHTRNGWSEMIEVLNSYKGRGISGIMHSFSGTVGDYLAIKECGNFLFGIGGPITYKNSPLVDVLERIPINDIVLETDSPYLPPVPYRGKRNESAYLKLICAKVAEIKGVSPTSMAEITTRNAKRIFNIDPEF